MIAIANEPKTKFGASKGFKPNCPLRLRGSAPTYWDQVNLSKNGCFMSQMSQ